MRVTEEGKFNYGIGITGTKEFYTDGKAKNYKFTSSDESVIKIDSNGNFTAIAEGTAEIRVALKDDEEKFYSEEITVVRDKIKDSNIYFSNLSDRYQYKAKAIKPNTVIYYTPDNTQMVKGTDYKISYSNNVEMGVASITIEGLGRFKGKVTKTFHIVPTTVKNLEIKTQSESSITLQWSKNAENITAYKVYMFDYSKGVWEYFGKTKETKLEVTGLSSGTIYKFKVRAYKNVDGIQYFGGFTPYLKATTKPVTAKITSITSENGKAVLKWKKISNASGYKIYMSTSENGKYERIRTLSDINTVKYSKSLEKGKTYYFKMRAYKTVNGEDVFGAYSDVVKITIK